jgi:hypothetical protein
MNIFKLPSGKNKQKKLFLFLLGILLFVKKTGQRKMTYQFIPII